MDKAPIELIKKRTVNSKTFIMPNGYRGRDFHIGDIHYKNNYQDETEQWKDIDLIWEGNRITKAPYELTVEGQKLIVRDKKTGEVSTLELIETQPAGIKWEIIPENTRVKFRHTLPSGKVPFQAQFRVTGKIPLTTRAEDDEDELPLEVTLKDGILTEKLSSLPRPTKGNIRIDPSWDLQVTASADDLRIYNDGTNWQASALTHAAINVGYVSSTALKQGNGLRFQNVTIPQGTGIKTAYLIMTARLAQSNGDVNSVVIGEDVDDAAIFSDLADYQARRGVIVGGANDNYITTASVNWNAIPAWSVDEEGADTTSPELKTVIQEIVDRGGWTSGNALVLFWDDHGGNSTAANLTFRSTYSYDGSSTKCPKLHIEDTLIIKVINETVNITETTRKVRGLIFIINETLQITETISRLRGLIRVINETVSITESVLRRGLLEHIDLALRPRTFSLTLGSRSFELTLKPRSFSLTLRSR